MAYVMLFINKLQQKQCGKIQELRLKEDLLDVEKIYNAEKMIVKLVLEGAFGPDIKSIKKSCLNENDQQHGSLQNKTLQELKPFVDENGIDHVGGRLQNSSLDLELIHPIILPKTGSTSTLIVRDYHKTVAHGSTSATMQEIRRAGYWIINCNALVSSVIFNCIRCRSMREKFGEQIMADLHKYRANEVPPFTYCGVDLFGPFLVKERRGELKRYGALFTSLH